jgi:putative transposase
MLLSKKIRLQLSADDVQALEFMQSKCRGLYNWWVMRLRGGERWPGWSTAKATLQESKEYDSELGLVYGKLLHEVYFRLDRAMIAFFRRVQAGEIPGFPRVRPRHAFSPSVIRLYMSRLTVSTAATHRRWGKIRCAQTVSHY